MFLAVSRGSRRRRRQCGVLALYTATEWKGSIKTIVSRVGGGNHNAKSYCYRTRIGRYITRSRAHNIITVSPESIHPGTYKKKNPYLRFRVLI